MKKFLVFMFILFSSQAHSFKGQPRELIVMESVSQKTTLEFNEIKNINLEDCSQFAHANPDATITAGRITYNLAESYGTVKEGNCVEVLADRSTDSGFLYLIYKEAETRGSFLVNSLSKYILSTMASPLKFPYIEDALQIFFRDSVLIFIDAKEGIEASISAAKRIDLFKISWANCDFWAVTQY